MADFDIAHSSAPVTWSFAWKNTRGPTGVKELGEDQAGPGAISWTMATLVPSVAHSSRPWALSYTHNSTRPLTIPRAFPAPGSSIRKSAVTPSLLHSSHAPRCMTNTRRLFTAARPPPQRFGQEGPRGKMPSRISAVPASVPSVLHSPSGFEVLKKRTPLTPMSGVAPDESGPGVTSLTSTVPGSVPLLFTNLVPVSGRDAVKMGGP